MLDLVGNPEDRFSDNEAHLLEITTSVVGSCRKSILVYRFSVVTVQSAKRLYPSRLRTCNFASHVTFLRRFCEEVAWVLRGISVSFAKFCEYFFVERGKQA